MRLCCLLAVACAACGEGPFEPCDVRDNSCQKRVIEEVESLRGSKGHVPKISVRSEADVVAEETAAITDDDRAMFASQNAVYALFGLADPSTTLDDFTAEHVDQIVAFYSEDSKAITVLDHKLDERQSTLVLAHELVHSMQDAEGLIATAKADIHSTDSELARRSMIEGEAEWYKLLAEVDMDKHKPGQYNWALYFDDWQAQEVSDAEADPNSIYDAPVQFEYAYGASYMHTRWENGGASSIVDVYSALPASTEDVAIVHPTEASDFLGDQQVPTLIDGYTEIVSDQIGWWVFNNWCSHIGVGVSCRAVTDDSLTGVVAPDGSTISIMRARFNARGITPGATQLADQLKTLGYWTTVVDGVLIATMTTGTAPADITTFVTGWRAFEAN